jgi:hypothetical protein
VYKSAAGSGNLQSDFSAEWDALVAKPFKTGQPSRTTESISQNGWRVKAGLVQFTFDQAPAAASLTTMSNGDRKMSIVVLLNSDVHQKDVDRFMASMQFAPIASRARADPAPQADASTPPRILGKWNRSASVNPDDRNLASWSGAGYSTSRYEFKSDGTYRFTQRNFRMLRPEIVIVKEQGTFVINGNQLTVAPQDSVVESYTKKNNVDVLGSLTSSQRRPLEKVAYAAAMHFFPGLEEWNLVLQANEPTTRDGRFAGNSLFANAWFFNQKFVDIDLTSPTGR